ncbi:hypothetical protein MD484_g7478, partial [Candolleomyces efflorescens]
MSSYSALEASMLASLKTRHGRAGAPKLDADILYYDHSGDFFSNDYLSIGKLPNIRQQFLNVLSQNPLLFGSTGSRALTGSTSDHIGLEQYFMKELQVDKAMIFNSGYLCNLTFFGYAPQADDVVLYDEFIHASIHDGLRISRAKDHTIPFAHNSVADFESKLKRILKDYPAISNGISTLFVVIESVYSMEGNFAPMEEIIDLVEKYVPSKSAHIVVDEAHSLGLYGPSGKGLLREWGLEDRVHSVIFTFTKSVNFVGAIKFCFEVMQTPEADQLRKNITAMCHFFVAQFLESTSDIPKSIMSIWHHETKHLNGRGLVSPIFPIFTAHPISLQQHLNKLGYAAKGIPHPAVPKGTERLRVVIHGGNTEDEIRLFVKRLRVWALRQVALTAAAQPESTMMAAKQACTSSK